MKNTIEHMKTVEVLQTGNGKYIAYLHQNHEPIVQGEEQVQAYQCDTYITDMYDFESIEQAEAWFTAHHDDLCDILARVERAKEAKAKAEQAQAYLNATDWVIAQLGEYQMLGKTLPDRGEILKKREEARQAIREVQV
jgi:viroplasmin and RNaseH domain-containing protein